MARTGQLDEDDSVFTNSTAADVHLLPGKSRWGGKCFRKRKRRLKVTQFVNVSHTEEGGGGGGGKDENLDQGFGRPHPACRLCLGS